MKISGFNVVYVEDIYKEFTEKQAQYIEPLVLDHLDEVHCFYVQNSAAKVYFYWYDREVFFLNRDVVGEYKTEIASEVAAEFCLPEDIFWDVITALGESAIEARYLSSAGGVA